MFSQTESCLQVRSSELHVEAGDAAATFVGAPRDGYKLHRGAATRQIEQIKTQSITMA